MQPHLQRVFVFFGLTLVFGVAVWTSEFKSANPYLLPASTLLAERAVGNVLSQPSDMAPQSSVSAPKNLIKTPDQQNEECPEETSWLGYNDGYDYLETYCADLTPKKTPTKPPLPGLGAPATPAAAALAVAKCTPPQVQKINAYGKPCIYKLPGTDLKINAKCVASKWCRAFSYTGQDGKEYSVIDKPSQAAGSQGAGDRYIDLTDKRPAPRVDYTKGPEYSVTKDPVLTGAKTPAQTAGPTTPSTGGPRIPADTAIRTIANSGNTSGGGPRGGTSPSGQTFRASPILGNIANWAFGNRGGGGSGGGDSSGGTVAYAPQGDPGFYNRNFEAADSQITFPDANPTPDKILAYLAQNTKRQQGDKVTAEELKERGVVENVVLQAINNVVTPVGDFIRSIFSGEEVSPPSGEEVSAAAKEEEREKKPPLERGRLVLTLAADDSLVPGDPTVLEPPRRPTYEAFESIPSSNRAWVQSVPHAGEGIEGIASAPPTYGWGEMPQEGEGGDAVAQDTGAPEVSRAPFEPFFPKFGFEGEAEEGGAVEPPRSFFSVMGKSFGTITDAVSSLFTNIGKSLLWWL